MTSGMVLGRFRLIEKVDACDAAASFTAVNGDLSAWVEVLDEKIPDTAIQRLKDQRAALAKLKRARAPEVIEFGEHDQRTFVAVRRQPGETLASRIQRGGMGAIEILDLLIEVADALAETHALGIAHGRLSEKCIYFAAAGGPREEIQILGFGLAGLTAGLDEQPKPEDDLRALGRIGYACLAGPDAASTLAPAKVLEKRPHLSKETRDLVLRLLEGEPVSSASELAELAREAKRIATTAIAPVRPPQRDAARIEVVLRTTIDVTSAEEEEPTPASSTKDTLDDQPAPRLPPPPRPAPASAPRGGMAPIDSKILFIVGGILILLILGLWVITTSGAGASEVRVESIDSE